MNPDPKVAGWCGILAGVGLAIEATLWTASGWNPGTFADPATPLEFLSTGGTTLRWAVASGERVDCVLRRGTPGGGR